MKYLELQFKISPDNEAAGDVLAALLADAGCETFVPSDEGLIAYIQQANYDEAAIDEAVQTLATLLPDCSTTYSSAEAPDENWNATWEAEHHFEPIDLPGGQQIQIIPRQAFGSGEHATTRLMLQLLVYPESPEKQDSPTEQDVSCPLAGLTVIDAGCGTGVLGIAALQMGASSVFAYDIDEWSVRNAEENFALNGYEANAPAEAAPIRILEGDAHILSQAPQADLLLANINRNILLADLPAFAAKLKNHARLLLSGFLEADIQPLVERASSLGLTLTTTLADGEWRALEFRK